MKAKTLKTVKFIKKLMKQKKAFFYYQDGELPLIKKQPCFKHKSKKQNPQTLETNHFPSSGKPLLHPLNNIVKADLKGGTKTESHP